MKELIAPPSLVKQVHEAILASITDGKLQPGERIIQEQVAQKLGVSRQPVQQALLLLRNAGILQDAPGRGLIVAPLDLDYVQNMYEVRSVIEGLAFRKAAEINAERARKRGPAVIQNGRKAVRSGSVAALIAADMKFHDFIYSLANNRLIAPTMHAHWTYTQRVMGEVLMRDERPNEIWAQHQEMMEAVMAGNGDKAETLARQHVMEAAHLTIARLRAEAKRDEAKGDEVAKGVLTGTG